MLTSQMPHNNWIYTSLIQLPTKPVIAYFFVKRFLWRKQNHPALPDLMFNNLGSFYAAPCFVTCIANYGLAHGPGNPNGKAQYPSGGEDVSLVVRILAEAARVEPRLYTAQVQFM